jgi:hypothetical protein
MGRRLAPTLSNGLNAPMIFPIQLVAAPLPTSPTRGEVPICVNGTIEPQEPADTLPLVGRVGEQVDRNPTSLAPR